jgi:RNA recognition motif-containing protein
VSTSLQAARDKQSVTASSPVLAKPAAVSALTSKRAAIPIAVSSLSPGQNPVRPTLGVPSRRPDAAEKELAEETEHRPIYVGNLHYDITEQELKELFARYGSVRGVTVPKDFFSGGGRGYAFIDMPNMAEARKALETLNGNLFRGRALRLDWSRGANRW